MASPARYPQTPGSRPGHSAYGTPPHGNMSMRGTPGGPVPIVSASEKKFMTRILEKTEFVRTDSMDLVNDPRFFTDNVIDKRLSAFGALAIVSGLMLQNAIDQSFDMRKDMNLVSIEGICQLIGFTLLCGVLFANMVATYVGVAQPYHTYRLMTSGPTGFETAAAYYLNKNIIAWRHVSIKLMLTSLPVFVVSSGFRFVPKFSRDATEPPMLPDEIPLYARVEGAVALAMYLIMAGALFYIHKDHESVFRTNYEVMWAQSGVGHMHTLMQTRMAPCAREFYGDTAPPDV